MLSMSQIDQKLLVRSPLSFNLGLLKLSMSEMAPTNCTTCLVSKNKDYIAIVFADSATLFTPHSFQRPLLRCPQILTLNQRFQHFSTLTMSSIYPIIYTTHLVSKNKNYIAIIFADFAYPSFIPTTSVTLPSNPDTQPIPAPPNLDDVLHSPSLQVHPSTSVDTSFYI